MQKLRRRQKAGRRRSHRNLQMGTQLQMERQFLHEEINVDFHASNNENITLAPEMGKHSAGSPAWRNGRLRTTQTGSRIPCRHWCCTKRPDGVSAKIPKTTQA